MKKCSLLVLFLVWSVVDHPLQGRDVSLRVDFAPAAVAASNKANELAKKGDLDGAINYYTAAAKIDPAMYVAIYWRGELYARQHKWEHAITDFTSALVVCPSFILAAIDRADANAHLGRYDRALAELNQVISVRPSLHANALAHTTRAWIYATCPNPAFRNGKQAVEDAKLACSIDSWDNWDYIDTLAAAYAEAGDYEKAIKFEEKAIKKARDAKGVEDAQQRARALSAAPTVSSLAAADGCALKGTRVCRHRLTDRWTATWVANDCACAPVRARSCLAVKYSSHRFA